MGDTVTLQTNALAVPDCEMQVSPQSAAAMRPIDIALAQFGAHTASFTSQALGAEWSCFYYLDAQDQPCAFQPYRTPWAVRESYIKQDMGRRDPLRPAALIAQNLSFVSVFDRRLGCTGEARRDYWTFLAAFGAQDSAEMIFRVGGRAVAGMSLLWIGRAGLRADRNLGEVVQSYIELNLAAHYAALPAEEFSETDIALELSLTERELDIVRLVCDGLTNARIAECLNIRLATVKTHLLHVFEKLGVRTRAELVGRCLPAMLPG
jgi:DNA-binding CsgD family transcriptional regulator